MSDNQVLSIPRVTLVAPHGSRERFIVAIGLIEELKRTGLSAGCVVVGPELLSADLLWRVSGHLCPSPDESLLSDQQILSTLSVAAGSCEVLLILKPPGILEGVAPAILTGNQAGIDMKTEDVFYEFQKIDFQHIAIEEFPFLTEEKRYSSYSLSLLRSAAECIQKSITVEKVLEVAQNAQPVHSVAIEPGNRTRTRIGVSRDSSFGLCYQENLMLLRHFGADLVYFSPLQDRAIPEGCGALYFSGGGVREYFSEFVENQAFQKSLIEFYKSGGILYSEGAGTAALCREVVLGKKVFQGAGVLSATVTAGENRLRYFDAETLEESLFGMPDQLIKGIDTGEWVISNAERPPDVFRRKGVGGDYEHYGFAPGAQVVSIPGFLNFASNLDFAKNLVDAAEVVATVGNR